jgi:hypothetical protein
MCGRYTQTAAFDELAQGFGTILENAGPEDLTARSNQFPTQNVPIIVVSKGVQQLVLVIILCTGISLGACAQMPPTTMQGSHEIEGRIVDVKGERMMLHDGTVLLVPGNVARWSELSLGAVVRVQYEEKDGQMVATAMVFREGAEGQRSM